MRRAILTLMTFVLTSALSFAQQVTDISGLVCYEASGTVVDLANVIIEDPDNHQVLGFAATSEDGCFKISLTTDKDSLQVVVSGFNIERKVVTIPCLSQEITLEVKYKEMSLAAARIKTNPIKASGDTTVYYVSMFADSLDRTIADVLKKMPGLSVDKGGAIRYQGVLIDKFYVEDLDMMGTRYGIATNNIRAQDVATIEVYENHQPVKILQNARNAFDGKGRVAVNIRLKQKSKGAFIGSALAGAGYGPVMWEGEFVGMLFTEKYQTLMSLKSNNSGRDIVSELQEQSDGLTLLSAPLGVYSPKTPELDKDRFMDNTTFASSLNNLYKVSKDKILSLNCIYIHDRQSFRDESLTRYYVPSSNPLEISESTFKSRKTDCAEVRLKYTDNGDHHYLTESLSAGIQWDNSEGEVLVDQSMISQRFKMKANKSLSNIFDYSILVRDSRWLGLKTDFGYKDLPAELSISPMVLPEIFGYDQTGGNSTTQLYSAKEFYADITPYYSLFIAPGMILRVETGAVFRQQNMTSLLGQAGMETTMEDCFRNDNAYDRLDLKAGASLSYRKNRFQFGINAEAYYTYLDSDDKVRKRKIEEEGLCLRPSSFVMFSITPRLKIELLSYYKDDFAAFGDNYVGYIMTDYRRIRNMDGTFTKNKNRGADLSIKYSDPLSAFFSSSMCRYWGKWSNTIYGETFVGAVSEIHSYNRDNVSRGYSLEQKMSKYYDSISSTFDLCIGYSQYWMTVMRQDVMINTDTRSPNLIFACTSNLGRKVKTRYNVGYSYFETEYDGKQGGAPIHSLHQGLSVEYQFLPDLIFRLSGEHYYNSSVSAYERHIPFLDGSILYRMKKCDIILDARNLLNTMEYSYSMAADATEYESAYKLRQRAIMLKIRFNIN